MSEAEILFDVKDGLGVMTLNRPKVLNSLSHGIILEMERVMPEWEKDPSIKAVVLRGAGDRAFSAGGDVAGLYREMRDNPSGTLRRDFFRDEYIVNRRIYRYAKPWISLIDGINMGGGVGLSAHGSHSVVTEKYLFAMPETTIGLFPDVGGGYFLTRLPGALGTFLALTSYRLKAADAGLGRDRPCVRAEREDRRTPGRARRGGPVRPARQREGRCRHRAVPGGCRRADPAGTDAGDRPLLLGRDACRRSSPI
jgi:enoyl-CoA hydratase/carnithine racemase